MQPFVATFFSQVSLVLALALIAEASGLTRYRRQVAGGKSQLRSLCRQLAEVRMRRRKNQQATQDERDHKQND